MLAILTTHPIQYQTPLWQALARDGRVPFEVWFLTRHAVRPSRDPEFGTSFAWDIDTLSGYPHRFLDVATGATPGSFFKCHLRERLRDRIREHGIRAVWIQGWQVAAYWQAVHEAKLAGAEVWLRGESNDLPPTALWKQLVKQIRLNWLFHNVDRFFCIGAANRRLYNSVGIPEHRLYTAPYAVDNDRFATQAKQLRPLRMGLRHRWGIPDDAFCVLFCGKLIPKKRPLDLVAAARRLKTNETRKVHLLFAGTGPLADEIRRNCRVIFDTATPGQDMSPDSSLPPASLVGFLNQTEVSQAYVAADCLVLPSDHRETWGLVVNEALASDLPCMVSRACGCAEDLAGEEDSFPVGDIAALASKLASIGGMRLDRRPLPRVEDTVRSIATAYRSLTAGVAAAGVGSCL